MNRVSEMGTITNQKDNVWIRSKMSQPQAYHNRIGEVSFHCCWNTFSMDSDILKKRYSFGHETTPHDNTKQDKIHNQFRIVPSPNGRMISLFCSGTQNQKQVGRKLKSCYHHNSRHTSTSIDLYRAQSSQIGLWVDTHNITRNSRRRHASHSNSNTQQTIHVNHNNNDENKHRMSPPHDTKSIYIDIDR